MRSPAAVAIFCLGATMVVGFGTHSIQYRRSPRARPRASQLVNPAHLSRAWVTQRTSSSRGYPFVYGPSAVGADKNDDYETDYSEYGYQPDFEIQDEDSISDGEMLQKWRRDKLLVNDRWQFGLYGKQNVGNWLGRWQEYVAEELHMGDEDDGDPMIGLVLRHTFQANTLIIRRLLDDTTEKKIFEHVQQQAEGMDEGGPWHPAPVIETLFADSFRGENGTQVVGNTYTMGAVRLAAPGTGPEDLGEVWVEIGLRARDVRVRCIFQYIRDDMSAQVERVFLVREGLERLPGDDALREVELYGAAGKGLYDPPRLSRSPLYMSLYAEGGLTIRFPLRVKVGEPGVFSVDWTAGEVRYQADRSFDELDGSCRRLEVTEIGTADAEIYLPQEKF